MLGEAILVLSPPEGIVFLGRFHAVMLHFPIGFLVLVFLLELYSLFRPGRELRKVIGFVLGMGALGAVVVAALGFVLAGEGGYDEITLNWHKLLGLGVVIFSVITAIAHHRGFRENASWPGRMAYRGILTVTVATLMAAGHFGGNLTHGSQYLVEHAPDFVKELLGESDPSIPIVVDGELTDGQQIYVDHVQPLFEAKCVQCHGPEKQKGGYRIDGPEFSLTDGDSGLPAIVPGDLFQSNLVRVILLPKDHDEAMPPEGKDVLTSDEMLTITHWIQNGAEFPDPDEAADVGVLAGAETSQRQVDQRDSGAVIGHTEVVAMTFSADGQGTSTHEAMVAGGCNPIDENLADGALHPASVPVDNDAAVAALNANQIDFINDIKPLLEEKCVRCHGAEKRKGGLRLHTQEMAFAGGSDFGAGIVPNQPEESSIYLQVSIPPDDDPDELLMPPTKKGGPLIPDEIARLQRWISEGAHWPLEVTLSAPPSDEPAPTQR